MEFLFLVLLLFVLFFCGILWHCWELVASFLFSMTDDTVISSFYSTAAVLMIILQISAPFFRGLQWMEASIWESFFFISKWTRWWWMVISKLSTNTNTKSSRYSRLIRIIGGIALDVLNWFVLQLWLMLLLLFSFVFVWIVSVLFY